MNQQTQQLSGDSLVRYQMNSDESRDKTITLFSIWYKQVCPQGGSTVLT